MKFVATKTATSSTYRRLSPRLGPFLLGLWTFPNERKPPIEAALLFRARSSKEKPAPRWTASLSLGIGQINGVSLRPELDRCAKD
jgi:hypothetical protein